MEITSLKKQLKQGTLDDKSKSYKLEKSLEELIQAKKELEEELNKSNSEIANLRKTSQKVNKYII